MTPARGVFPSLPMALFGVALYCQTPLSLAKDICLVTSIVLTLSFFRLPPYAAQGIVHVTISPSFGMRKFVFRAFSFTLLSYVVMSALVFTDSLAQDIIRLGLSR